MLEFIARLYTVRLTQGRCIHIRKAYQRLPIVIADHSERITVDNFLEPSTETYRSRESSRRRRTDHDGPL